MEIWSHRGRTSSDELGNSFRNFMTAYYSGVAGIETDISLTADKKIIIYHPGSTRPDLALMNWRDIKNSIFNNVADLNAFLNLLSGLSGIKCCLDIKQNSEELVEEAVKSVLRKKLKDRIYFTAFQKKISRLGIESDGQLLLLTKEICPTAKTHLIAIWPSNLLELAEKYNPDMISFGWLQEPRLNKLVSKTLFKIIAKKTNLAEQIKEIKNRGIKTLAGIFNDPKDVLYFSDLGVDGDPLRGTAS